MFVYRPASNTRIPPHTRLPKFIRDVFDVHNRVYHPHGVRSRPLGDSRGLSVVQVARVVAVLFILAEYHAVA